MKKAVTAMVWIVALFPGLLQSAQVVYEEGTHYVELQIPLRTRVPGKVEVTEYFSYGCPHCYQFDPTISAWEEGLGDDVVFNRTPATWNQPGYRLYAQTYYTAEAMGVLDKIHSTLFEAIHSQQRSLSDPKAMAMFFSEFGVDPLDFAKVYNSFGVRASMQQAEARGRSYRATGVPAIVVNGKYRIDTGMAGSPTNMLRVADFLVERERALLAD